MNAPLAIGTRRGLLLARSRACGPLEAEPVPPSTIAVPSMDVHPPDAPTARAAVL